MKQSVRAVWQGDRTCRSITRHHARSFYFASICLPRPLRIHAYRVYGFCRWVDNLVDDASNPRDAASQLDRARTLLINVYTGDVSQPGPTAFRKTILEREIPIEHFLSLLDGMEMDLTKSRYADFDELELYCHRVAGVVGYIMTHLFGFRHERCLEPARSLGIAMQLTNILRDIREDFDRGRVYLPLTELDEFGIDETALARHEVNEQFRSLLEFQIGRARGYYEHALSGIPDLIGSTSRQCTRLMGRLYGGILHEIERIDFDVFQTRARISQARKIRILLECQSESLREAWNELWW